MTEQSTALRLADAIDPATIHALAFCREAANELRRLHQYEQALNEWQEKTEWVQKTAQPGEFGMHRADILSRRIGRLKNQRDQLLAALKRYHSIIAANVVELDCDGAFEQARAAIKAVEE